MNIEALLDANRRGKLPVEPTDWFYRNMVPKTLEENIAYRKKILSIARSSEDAAYELRCICARDILFEINTFGWTYSPKDHPDSPIRPFITYGFQDEAIVTLRDAIGKQDVGVPKSRDMGASWISILVMEHRWRYTPNQSFLLASRKEEYVDGKQGDMDALIPKIEWYTNHLPMFLRPLNVGRTRMNLLNRDNKSRFTGEATVENLGTGGRRTAIFLDEVSKMPGADDIFTSTRDVTNCRIFNSTPNGRFGIGEPFYKKIANPDTKKIFLHWSEHPTKSRGLYYLDEKKQKHRYEDGWNWRQEYDFGLLTFTGRAPRSDWYDEQVKREDHNLRKIAQECDINFVGSGMSFVSGETITRMIAKHAVKPTTWGRLLVDPEELTANWQASDGPVEDAPFKLFMDLVEGRPPLGEYSIGADIAGGSGGAASSNSTLVATNKQTKRVVLTFAMRTISPIQFARMSVGVCRWLHDALLVPETNGLGGAFLKEVTDIGYWNLSRRTVEAIGFREETEKVGYKNNDRGTELLTALVDGMETERVIITDEAILRELGQYVWDADGKIFHAGAKETDAAGDRGTAHGDRAIAAGCSYLGLKSLGELTPDAAPAKETSRNCPAARFAAQEAKQRAKTSWGYKW
jgi:hypothetical protein